MKSATILHSWRWTAEATAWRTHATTASAEVGTMSAVAHALSSLLASEGIEAIDGMYHGVAIDTVVLRIATLHGVDGTAEVALIVQNVVELE